MDWVIIENSDDFDDSLEVWKDGWESAFKRKLDSSLLCRYFLDPPLGHPIYVTGFSGDKLVASSTLVPLCLKNKSSKNEIRYLQLIASFVRPQFSDGFNTYKEMILKIRKYFESANYDFILSFPNKNAVNLMRRVGGFDLLDEGYFIEGELSSDLLSIYALGLKYPFFSPKLLEWRIHGKLNYKNGLVIKNHNGKENLLDVLDVSNKPKFVGLMPWWKSWGNAPFDSDNSLRLNMCVYPSSLGIDIKRSFLLSDIF